MIRARRFPHIIAALIILLAWSPWSRLDAQGRSTQSHSEQRARIKQKIASSRAENKVIVKNKRFGPARMEGGASVREGSMTLSVNGRPSRTIRVKIREKVTKAAPGDTDQSITVFDEETGQESVWSLANETGTVTLAVNGAEKLKATANPDGTLSVNGVVHADEKTAGDAAGHALTVTDLIPESAQAVAETVEMLIDEGATTSRSIGLGVVAVIVIVVFIGIGVYVCFVKESRRC